MWSRYSKYGVALVPVFAVAFVVGLAVVACGPSRGTKCAQHLKMATSQLLLYAHDHKGMLPESLEDLVRQGYVKSSARSLECPESGSRYVYAYDGCHGVKLDAVEGVLLHDKVGYHLGGGFVSYADGSVEWLPSEQFDEKVRPRSIQK